MYWYVRSMTDDCVCMSLLLRRGKSDTHSLSLHASLCVYASSSFHVVTTSAGLAGMLVANFVWLLIAWIFGTKAGFHVVVSVLHLDKYFGQDLVASGLAMSFFVLAANLVPAYPLDASMLLVAGMRLFGLNEDEVMRYYGFANASAFFILLTLAASHSSVIWTLVAVLPGLQALHIHQLRTRNCIHMHPLFRRDDDDGGGGLM